MTIIHRVFLLIGLLGVGFLLAFALTVFLKMPPEEYLVAVVLAPAVIYAIIFSGSLRELAVGTKGVTVKLANAANEAVPLDFGTIGPTADDMQQVGELGASLLEQMLANYKLSEQKPIVMKIMLGVGDYKRENLLGFVEKLSRYKSFVFIVFLYNNRLEFVMPAWGLRQILSKLELGDEFLSIVNRDSGFGELSGYPHFMSKEETIREGSSNSDALRKMSELGTDAVIVINDDYDVKGVAMREDIVSRIILKLTDKKAS